MTTFGATLAKHQLRLHREELVTVQLNLGRKCNQACRHCHVDAAPWRTEMMDSEVVDRVADWIQRHRPAVVDLTGGAPEIHPDFRRLVRISRSAGAMVIDRNNLTIIEEPGFDWLPEFLAAHQVEVIASLPCYQPENVSRQRGQGVFEKSISALKKLNAQGYGSRLVLNLVYNPVGATLPAPQAELENDYKAALLRDHGVRFNRLYTLTNQPIARFAEDLRRQGKEEEYLALLRESFNPTTVAGLMCRSTLSVNWLGELFDCDFNQMLGMQMGTGTVRRLWEISPSSVAGLPVATGEHCFACTAGHGSSCTGALRVE